MNIEEFLELLISDDQRIEIWDNQKNCTVFKGEACDVPDEYHGEEIVSIDPIQDNVITLNIR